MKRTVLMLQFAVLLMCHICSAAQITEKQSEYWSNVLSESDFNKVIVSFIETEVGWPIIVSPEYNSVLSDEEIIHHEKFRDLAKQFTYRLEKYTEHLQTLPLKEFVNSSALMIATRNQIVRYPSYINVVLSDTITRVLFVNIANRIVKGDQMLPAFANLVEKLIASDINIKIITKVVEMELGKSQVKEDVRISSSEEELYRILWKAIEGETPILFPEKIYLAGTYDLLESRHIGLLLWRYINTDYQVRTVLPLAIEYRSKVDVFSPNDDYKKIKGILGREIRYESLGSRIIGVKLAGEGVSDLLYRVRTDKMKNHLLFGKMKELRPVTKD